MNFRLINLYLRILIRLSFLCQVLISRILNIFGDKSINIPVVGVPKRVYLGSKVFSNYSFGSRDNIEIIDISSVNCCKIDNSVLILNNNDFINSSCFSKLNNIKKKSCNIQIIIWDFDNHHMPANSLRLMNLSNIYFAAHNHNFDFFRLISPKYFGILSACVIQWPKSLLLSSDSFVKSKIRSNELFGPHVFHPQFNRRNGIISFVSNNFPKVFFTDLNYHVRSVEDRFWEWCNYKVHFVAPVDLDIPIRLLDAIITGGIPLVPVKLKSLIHSLSLDRFVVFYDENQLDSLGLRVDEAINKFDHEGIQGIASRVKFVLDNHHIDSRVNFLIDLHL